MFMTWNITWSMVEDKQCHKKFVQGLQKRLQRSIRKLETSLFLNCHTDRRTPILKKCNKEGYLHALCPDYQSLDSQLNVPNFTTCIF